MPKPPRKSTADPLWPRSPEDMQKTPENDIALVMKGALVWVGTGLAIGVILSSLVSATLKHSFAAFGVDVIPSLVASLAALLTAGAAAGLLPAQRAASTDPAKTLRDE